MIHTQNMKVVKVIAPAAIVDADDPVGAYGDANPVSIDTLGYHYLDIYVMLGATDIDMTALGVFAGDVAAAGADDTDFAAVTGAVFSGTTGEGRIPQDDDDGKIFHVGIANPATYGRYFALDATCGDGTAGTYITAWAVLSRADESPNTATARGFAGELLV